MATAVAVVTKADYQKVFEKREKMALNDKVSFLKSLPYFARWTKVSLAKLSYFFHEVTFKRH